MRGKATLLSLFLLIGTATARCTRNEAGHYVNGERKPELPACVGSTCFTQRACVSRRLHRDCVSIVNRFRRESGLAPLIHAREMDACTNEKTMGEMLWNVLGGGECAGAHQEAFVCPGFYGDLGDNSCCARGFGSFGDHDNVVYDTYLKMKRELASCLTEMWTERANNDTVQTHHEIMASPKFKYVSCGFAFTKDGRMMATQSYASHFIKSKTERAAT